MSVLCWMTPAKEGCSVLTTLVDTSASPRVLSSISVKRENRCRRWTLFLPSPQANQVNLSFRQWSTGPRSRAGPLVVQPDSLQMSRTSAEVRSDGQAFLTLSSAIGQHEVTLKYEPFIFYCFTPTRRDGSSYLIKRC